LVATMPKSKRGRPRITLTDDQMADVEEMARAQCKDGTIATALGIDPVTFKRSFEAITRKKRAEGKIEIRKAQFRLAIEKLNPTMLIWLGKQELGQSDRPISTDDKPLVFTNIDLDRVAGL